MCCDEAVHWSLGLSATYLRNDWLGASPAVAISWSALGLTACPGWGLDLHMVLEVCGTTAVGRLQATDRAVEAGAAADSVEIVEVEEVPLAYLPSNATRIRVKAVGDLARG